MVWKLSKGSMFRIDSGKYNSFLSSVLTVLKLFLLRIKKTRSVVKRIVKVIFMCLTLIKVKKAKKN